MFITILFTVAKIWNQLKVSINKRMDEENVVQTHNGKLFSLENRRKSCHLQQYKSPWRTG
jgi:hypothetical protein